MASLALSALYAGNAKAQTIDKVILDSATQSAIGKEARHMKVAEKTDTNIKESTSMTDVIPNRFGDNWEFTLAAQGLSFYSNQEVGKGYRKNPFVDFRVNLGFTGSLGKWFSPAMQLRTKGSALWGRSVSSPDKDANAVKYWNIQEQAVINISNLLYNYSPTMVWNLSLLAGAGVARDCSHDVYSLSVSAGMINSWRLGKRVRLVWELGVNGVKDDFDGISVWNWVPTEYFWRALYADEIRHLREAFPGKEILRLRMHG